MANVAEFNIDFTDLKVLNETLNKTTDKVELMASSAKKDFNRWLTDNACTEAVSGLQRKIAFEEQHRKKVKAARLARE